MSGEWLINLLISEIIEVAVGYPPAPFPTKLVFKKFSPSKVITFSSKLVFAIKLESETKQGAIDEKIHEQEENN